MKRARQVESLPVEDGSVSSSSNSNGEDQFGTVASSCFFPMQKRRQSTSASSASSTPSSALSTSFRWARAPAIAARQALPPPTEAELLMAKEMQQLSLNERELVYEDLHGCSKHLEEQPDSVDECLLQLDVEIAKVRHKAAYDKALFLNPTYVKGRDFRIMFLRTDLFDVRKAAKRMVEHFRLKLGLFDAQRLAKRIHWKDMSDDDRATYNTGAIQFFPSCKDRIGRALFFNIYAYRNDQGDIKSLLRAYWYAIMSCLQEDEDTQRKGAVAISYTLGASASDFYAKMVKQSKHVIVGGLPVRLAGGHFCFEDQSLRPLFSLLQSVSPKSWLLRIRPHFGSHLEIFYTLNSFGISTDILPIDGDGRIKRDVFDKNQAAYREIEDRVEREIAESKSADKIDIPEPNDVLLGRGMPFQKYSGTVRLMAMVEQHKPQHDKSLTRLEKTAICIEIIKQVKQVGGRFLKRDPESGIWWVEVDDEVAREKVAMGFRNLARKGKGQLPLPVGSDGKPNAKIKSEP